MSHFDVRTTDFARLAKYIKIGMSMIVKELDTFNIKLQKNNVTTIPRLQVISYSQFFIEFMANNKPCIIENVTSNWLAAQKWTRKEGINYNSITADYGDFLVSVADCNKFEFDAQCKEQSTVANYMLYLENGAKINHNKTSKVLYLKDWHLKRECPQDNFYEVPDYFISDWLNEYATDNDDDDFRFVYIGSENSWTPLHVDVYSSYSWSANVFGKKRWILFPPEEEPKLLKFKNSNTSPGYLDSVLENTNIIHFDIIQDSGDAIFVPSGWYHQVHNLTETISINHNWMNGCNVMYIWNALNNSNMMVEEEISEFRNSSDWPQQCQLMLKSFHGMDYLGFMNLILFIGKKRCKQLINSSIYVIFEKYYLGINHIIFDLISIKSILTLCIASDKVKGSVSSAVLNEINALLNSISDNLKKYIEIL